MAWEKHSYRVGSSTAGFDSIPTDVDELATFINEARKRIEPWLSAVFQAEHLNLLIGSGFTSAVAASVGTSGTSMAKAAFGTPFDDAITASADATAKTMGRGEANIEDQFRSAMAVQEGFSVIDPAKAADVKTAIDAQLRSFLSSLLTTERAIATTGDKDRKRDSEQLLTSFLLSFASRAASRERLHIFTSNYDRLIEHGCDLAGLRIIDRFVGALNPIFRSTRVDVDMHYNPPGIRGEPRFMEGVVRLTKLHGSLDWHFSKADRLMRRIGIPFGAPNDHTDMPKEPLDTVMVYPNPAKDIETTEYPYAELFRDFAASICRPNSVVVTYGYGFGDDHINRVLLDMLAIPSTHLVIMIRSGKRAHDFCQPTRDAQVSLLVGHFADLSALVQNYLPKPALDYITGRWTDLLKQRMISSSSTPPTGTVSPADPPF